MLNLMIATRYISKLVSNRIIVSYLDEHHPEILKEFHTILSATSLNPAKKTDTASDQGFAIGFAPFASRALRRRSQRHGLAGMGMYLTASNDPRHANRR
jgi:hypothetical protein